MVTDTETRCAGPQCDRPVWANGLCNSHAKQANRHQPLTPLRAYNPARTCSYEGCERSHWGKGLCRNHYAQNYRTGKLKPIRAPKETVP